MVHLLLAYQTLVVMTGIVTTILFFICHKKKPYLNSFQLFYLCFTTITLLELLAMYALSNIPEGSTLFVFLTEGLSELIANVMLFFAIKTFHILLPINRPKTEWLIIISLVLETIFMIPYNVKDYIPEISSYTLIDSDIFSSFLFLSVFTYLISISIFRVWKIVDKADRHFGILLSTFACLGYLQSISGMFFEINNLSINDDIFQFDPSNLYYWLFSLFLIRLLFRTIVHNSHIDTTLTEEKLSLYHFSTREKELLPLILCGKSNQQIADQLNISLSTVKTHLNKIFKKSVVKSRFELAQKLKS